MSKKEALSVLMMSPFYFRLSVVERKKLIDEFIKPFKKKDENPLIGFILGYD